MGIMKTMIHLSFNNSIILSFSAETVFSSCAVHSSLFASLRYFEAMPLKEPPEASVKMDGENPAVFTLEEALASVGFGKFQLLVLAYAGLGLVADTMEIMILSFIGPVVKSQWDISSSQESLLSTVVFAGMLVGAFFWGLFSDYYGRRKGFLGVTILTSGFGLLSAFSPTYESLVILRCLVGFAVAGGSVLCTWFLEFVPASHRGTKMLVLAILGTSGAIFEASLAWIVVPRLGWRWLLSLSSLPTFSLLLFYPIVPESPRYLCTTGRINDAHHILKKMALINQSKLPPGMLVFNSKIGLDEESSTSEYTPLLPSARKMDLNFKSGFSSFASLFSSKLLRTTILLWVSYFGNVFSFYGIMLLTSELSSGPNKCGPTDFLSENLQDDSFYKNVFITNFADIPGILLSTIIVDRIGRKLSVAFMSVLACIFLLPLLHHQPATLTTALLFGARMSTKGSITIVSVYAQELYPTMVRATGAGATSAVGRIGGMICPLVAVGLVSGCQLKEAIMLFEVVIGFSAISVLLFPFETKGQELSDGLNDVSDSKQVVASVG